MKILSSTQAKAVDAILNVPGRPFGMLSFVRAGGDEVVVSFRNYTVTVFKPACPGCEIYYSTEEFRNAYTFLL